MSSRINMLFEKGLLDIPRTLPPNIHYEVIMGSTAYGVSTDTSDLDLYAMCMPPKSMIFPHLNGEIVGFNWKEQRTHTWQNHHILDGTQSYDFQLYSITRYFALVMENNPNMIDSLFVPDNCILHCTSIGQVVREYRRNFLHKGAWVKFKGYAYQQAKKMRTKESHGKRKESVEKYGYDIKFAYHIVRLLNEVEQILTEGDLDLQRNREQLKSIRRGEWTLEQVEEYLTSKERELEKVYNESTIPVGPNELEVRDLLVHCLEKHYGDISDAVSSPDRAIRSLQQIRNILDQSGF